MDKLVLKECFPDDKLTLEILAEEAAEICQAKSKIIRFGLDDIYVDNEGEPVRTNRQKLEHEIKHLLAVIEVLEARGIISLEDVEQDKQDKWIKMQKWNAYTGTKKTDWTYKDGEPCDHPGCCQHSTHPCEGCGRIGCHQGGI